MSSEYISLVTPQDTAPPKSQVGVIGWMRQNLFSDWQNSLLTVLALWVIYHALGGLFNWAVRFAVFLGTDPAPCKVAEGACWPLVSDNWQIFLVGSYPL